MVTDYSKYGGLNNNYKIKPPPDMPATPARGQSRGQQESQEVTEMIVKIGTVELTEQEAEKLYFEKKYIVNYSGVYQLFYSAAQRRVYGQKIYSSKGLTKRGRFFAFTAEQVNRLIGIELVAD